MNATDISGWVYNAETYCTACVPGDTNPPHEDPFYCDSDHYPQPIFVGSEILASCQECGSLLSTSWGPYEVDYARELLTSAVHDDGRTSPFLDELAEHLSWCALDFPAMLALARYQRLSERIGKLAPRPSGGLMFQRHE